MTSGLDGLGAAALPNLTTMPNVASVANAPSLGSPSTAKRRAGGFDRLMNLQSRTRALETKLQQETSGTTTTDPAHDARLAQSEFYASELKTLRELAGGTPGGNTRRALAAIVARLEAGGELKPTDRSRVHLAIAADERRIDLAGADKVRSAILSLDGAAETLTRQAKDPATTQDPARLAVLRAESARLKDQTLQLVATITRGERVDVTGIHGIFEARRH